MIYCVGDTVCLYEEDVLAEMIVYRICDEDEFFDYGIKYPNDTKQISYNICEQDIFSRDRLLLDISGMIEL